MTVEAAPPKLVRASVRAQGVSHVVANPGKPTGRGCLSGLVKGSEYTSCRLKGTW